MTATLAAFALAATLLILAPGPDSMLVLRNTLRGGRRAGWVTASGTLSGLLVWATAAALGLSALLQASRVGYDVLRIAGAGYLAWLGLTSLGLFRRAEPAPEAGGGQGRPVGDETTGGGQGRPVGDETTGGGHGRPARDGTNRVTKRRMYLTGLVSNLLNPKIGVFFVAFLPGFIPSRSPAPALSFGLGLWFAAETGVWLATLAWLAARGVGWLSRPGRRRWLERVTGVVLIGFGVRLALASR
jgi:threonine/homoserine/homoserine lactone efflux protein